LWLAFDGVLEISNVVVIAMVMVVNEKASLEARSLDRAFLTSQRPPRSSHVKGGFRTKSVPYQQGVGDKNITSSKYLELHRHQARPLSPATRSN
jgi:hypothetical protein